MRSLPPLLLLPLLSIAGAAVAIPAKAAPPAGVDEVMKTLEEGYPAYRAIATAEPETYRRMRSIVASDLAAGAPAPEIRAHMQREVKEVYQRRLRTAPDELILAYAGFMADVLAYLEQHDVRACAALMTADAAEPAEYSAELSRRDSDILTRVVTTAPAPHALASPEEAARMAQEAAAAGGAELHQPTETIAAAMVGQGTPQQVCRGARAFVSQLNRLGAKNPAVLRTLLLTDPPAH